MKQVATNVHKSLPTRSLVLSIQWMPSYGLMVHDEIQRRTALHGTQLLLRVTSNAFPVLTRTVSS